MQAPWRRAASITLAAWMGAWLIGCKQPSEKADDAIHDQLLAANQKADAPGQNAGSVLADFQKAANIPDSSDVAKVQAQLAFANASGHAADELIHKIEDRQVQMVELTSLLEEKASRIAANNAQIAALKAMEPTAAQGVLDKQTAAAKGGSDGAPWVAGDAAPIPSTAGATQQIATLKDQIDKLTTQKNNLQTQRAQLLLKSEQLRNQSEAAKGQQSVDLFVQSSDLAKQAGDLSTQSTAIDARIAAAQQDLAVVQAVQTQLETALQKLNKQSAQIKASWSDVQKAIADRSDQSAALLNGSPGDASAAPADAGAASTTAPAVTADLSITAAAAMLVALNDQNAGKYQQAVKYLDDALNALKTASTTSSVLVRNYTLDVNDIRFREFPQRDAWQVMIDVHNPSDLKLAIALEQLRLARLYSDMATTTASRARAAKAIDAALTAASLTTPDTLKAGSLEDELAAAHKLADDAYAAAEALFVEIQEGSGGSSILARSAKDTAQAIQVVELYARAQFAAAMGDQKSAQGLLSLSKRAREDAIASNIQLPVLPTELAKPQSAAASASATSGPSATPTTNPTSGPVFDTNQR